MSLRQPSTYTKVLDWHYCPPLDVTSSSMPSENTCSCCRMRAAQSRPTGRCVRSEAIAVPNDSDHLSPTGPASVAACAYASVEQHINGKQKYQRHPYGEPEAKPTSGAASTGKSCPFFSGTLLFASHALRPRFDIV